MSDIQLKGNLLADPAPGPAATDVSDFVSEFRIQTQRAGITRPATLGTGTADTVAGSRTDNLIITFHSSQDAEDFWALLYEVISSASSEVVFSGTMNQGAVSADNREWSGTATLLSLDTGAPVGSLRQQTVTLPIKQGTLLESITP